MNYLNVQAFIMLCTMLIKFLLRLKLGSNQMTRVDFILLVFVKSKVYENNNVLLIVDKLIQQQLCIYTQRPISLNILLVANFNTINLNGIV